MTNEAYEWALENFGEDTASQLVLAIAKVMFSKTFILLCLHNKNNRKISNWDMLACYTGCFNADIYVVHKI